MKLSNFLDTALTDLQNGYSQIPLSGPSRIIGNFSEVFSARGDHTWCYFLCSFAISKVLRLTIECNIDSDDNIWFGIAFIPADVPTNKALFAAFKEIPSAADVWMMIKERSKIPLELYVTHGNLLSTNKDKEISRSVGKCGRFSCNVEIVNCLNVSLKNRNQCEKAFSDQGIRILKQSAFTQIPAVTDKKDLEALMNPSQWKIHDYKKYSNGSKVLEMLQNRFSEIYFVPWNSLS
ncbi:unnamed protein product [Allacma fusca]|uniref:Uncharacterized protein n=1 Tax=Allacma fusca TaxID=39272 RepID=A0A8J2KN33_9HEXA|nr:unnamed protein product [Allacma fusca]